MLAWIKLLNWHQVTGAGHYFKIMFYSNINMDNSETTTHMPKSDSSSIIEQQISSGEAVIGKN